MYYAIICEDQRDSLSKRVKSRPAHLQRLHELEEQGRILTAGPHPAVDNEDPGDKGFVGSLIIANSIVSNRLNNGPKMTHMLMQGYTRK